MSIDFDQYLRSAFPEKTDATVIRNVTLAVALADDLRRNTPWLINEIGDDLQGNLRRAAAMWRLGQACNDGELPFSASEISNKIGSSHLLLIKSGAFEAHVVRTESSGAFPKDAPIRQDSRVTNEPTLFDDPKVVRIVLVEKDIEKAYAWLMFNATQIGALTHVCWGMPLPKKNKFLAHFDILRLAMSKGSPIDPGPPKKLDPTEKLKFKRAVEEEIERKKSGRKDTNKKG
ncbi:MAG: hypothetical protein JO084_06290 [Bradyrhizobiaceae bacterium]|nr:hypothetical protein [Hyphomicrobiales bacterium]MBV9427311.1 hypothetical protein [Bradyrhizobiaceae bacterium]